MNELTKHQENGLQKVDHILLKPNALQVHEDELFNTVNASIAKCFADLNKAVLSEQSLSYLVNEVTNSILNKFPTIRLQEIPIAFQKGIRNEYGDYFGLCVVSFEQFIQGYLSGPDRKQLVDEKNKLMIDVKTEPTKDEKFSTAKWLCLDAYNQIKNNKPLGLNGVAVYTFLNTIGLIHPDYKKGIYKEALNELVNQYEKDISFCTELNKRRALNTKLELLNQNIAADGITADQHEEVLRTGKRIILTNWLRDMLLDNTDLSELIETKRHAS